MKSVILVPTDFSENALLAARFAVSLAAQSHSEVCFLHAFTAFRSAFQGEQVNEASHREAIENANEEMARFLGNFSGETSVPDTVIMEGNLPDAIDRFLSGSSVKLIVMGTTGASGLKYHVLGSNTFEVSKHLTTVPLVVVPPGVSRFSLGKVAFFTDFNQADLRTLSSLKAIFSSLPEIVRVIHFGKADNRSEQETKLAEWTQMLKDEAGIPHLTWLWIEGEEGMEGVEKLDEVFDLFVLTLTEKGFFEKLFNKSMAKELIHQSKIPVFLTDSNA